MFDNLKKTTTDSLNFTAQVLRWYASHPKICFLLTMNYLVLPTLASEINNMFVRLNCGAFEVINTDVDSSMLESLDGLLTVGGRACFFPFRHLGGSLMYCHIGDGDDFDAIPAGEGALKADFRNNKDTICEQFNRF